EIAGSGLVHLDPTVGVTGVVDDRAEAAVSCPLGAADLGRVRVVALDLSFEPADHHRLPDLESAGRANPSALVALGGAKLISDRIQQDRLSIVGTEDPYRATVVDRPRETSARLLVAGPAQRVGKSASVSSSGSSSLCSPTPTGLTLAALPVSIARPTEFGSATPSSRKERNSKGSPFASASSGRSITWKCRCGTSV